MRLTALIATLIVAAAALAGMPTTQKMKCPIGGKKFTYTTTMSYSTFGARPDGKPYGSWQFPLELPVCPDNGLVVYAEFTADDVRKVKPLVASKTYQGMRGTETPYYLAQWLMRALDAPIQNVLWTLLQASWEADGNANLKARYQREYIELAATYVRPDGGDDLEWIVTQARAVNALRELGRLEEARALLESIPLQSLDVPIPEEKVSGTTESGYGKFIENAKEIDDAERRRSWIGYFEKIKSVIERGDTSSEPIDMIPRRFAAERCLQMPASSSPGVKAVCESEGMAAEMERIRTQLTR